MTAIAARLAKWGKVAGALLVGAVGVVIAAFVFWLRNKERGSARADSAIDDAAKAWVDAEAVYEATVAVARSKSATNKAELREIKREAERRVRLERLREIKERVMREGKS